MIIKIRELEELFQEKRELCNYIKEQNDKIKALEDVNDFDLRKSTSQNIEIGDIVVVRDAKSCFEDFEGSYGVVEYIIEETKKAMVKFKDTFNGKGSISHTVILEDLEKVGEMI